jgi:hypothetical protein
MRRVTLLATDAERTPISLTEFTIQEIDDRDQLMVITAPETVFEDTPIMNSPGAEAGYSVVVTTAGSTYSGFIEEVETDADRRTYTCGIAE